MTRNRTSSRAETRPASPARPATGAPAILALALLLLAVAPSPRADSPPPLPSTVDSLAWIVGCWARTDAEKGSGETWRRSGDRLVGQGRTVVGGRVAETEALEIRRDERGLVLVARPNGQEPTTFRLVRASGTAMVFENPFHDFPQRIVYERKGDALDAKIEGTLVGGKKKVVPFPMTAIPCG